MSIFVEEDVNQCNMGGVDGPGDPNDPEDTHKQIGSEQEYMGTILHGHITDMNDHTTDMNAHTPDMNAHTLDTPDMNEHTSYMNEHTPDMNEHTPDMNDHTPDMNVHTPDMNVHTPDTPDMNEHTPDMNDHTPDMNVHTPDTPDMNDHTPDLNDHTPDMNDHTPDMNEHTPDTNEHTPDMNEHTPDMNEHTPDMNEHTQDVHDHTRDMNEHTQDVHEHTRDMNDHTPDMNDHTPDTNDYTPDMNYHTPDMNEHTPDMNEHTPDMNDYTPDMNYHTPDMNAHTPDTSDMNDHTPDMNDHTPDMNEHKSDMNGAIEDISEGENDEIRYDSMNGSMGCSSVSSSSASSRQTLLRREDPDKPLINGRAAAIGCKRRPLNRFSSVGCTRDSTSALPTLHSTHSAFKSTRCSSAWSLWSCSSAQPAMSPRENKVSIRRKQLAHSTCDAINEQDAYLTPFQRKEQTIRDLRADLKSTHYKLQEREEDIQTIVSQKDVEVSVILTGKDTELHEMRQQVRNIQEENVQLKEDMDKVMNNRDDLKLRNKELELDMKASEERHAQMYLVMYEKGMKSADFERQDKIEEMAKEDPCSVPVAELLSKLESTQSQLAQLQLTTRQNSYDDASFLLSPGTDSEVTLRCVRDALFHYLTCGDKIGRKQHLDIMLALIGFTDPQKRKIDKSVSKSKKKS